MPNSYFAFKQFIIYQDRASFKVGTDGVLLGAYAHVDNASSILDVGSGTGLIALMLAQRSGAVIVALEPDQDSFQQCINNVDLCPWKSRIKVANIKIQDFRSEERFDLIVSNPPYFTNSLKNPDPGKSAARHNDDLSSDELLEHAERLLLEKGRLQVIMPWVEGNLLIARAAGYGLFCNEIVKIKPMASSPVRRIILTFSRQKMKPLEKFLTIEQGARHEFTQEYIDLTREFYLKF